MIRDRDARWLWHVPAGGFASAACFGNAWGVWTYKRQTTQPTITDTWIAFVRVNVWKTVIGGAWWDPPPAPL
jgi:hypothetical protein